MDVNNAPYEKLAAPSESDDSAALFDPSFREYSPVTGDLQKEPDDFPLMSDRPERTAFPTLGGSRRGQGHKARNKKSSAHRKMSWLCVSMNGARQTVEMDKRQLIQTMHLEIPIRDMRLLDPALQTFESSLAQMLIRDNALVFSMEHLRLIITHDKVLIPVEYDKGEAELFNTRLSEELRERSQCEYRHRDNDAPTGPALGGGSSALLKDPDALPFELQVLELALREICMLLTAQVGRLEDLAHPALEALTRLQDKGNLDRVRKIKTQYQRIKGRVTSVRDTLKGFLDDDQDMWRMCLSKRAEQELEGESSRTFETLARLGQFRLRHSSSVRQSSPPQLGTPTLSGVALGNNNDGSDTSSESDDFHDFLEVENLLESYYMVVDSAFQKLMSIGEYIDDTEDYVNIELDFNRNRLIRIEILITTATFSLAFFNLAAGILGENLKFPDYWQAGDSVLGFIVVNSAMFLLVVAIFLGIFAFLRSRKLI